MPGESEHRQSSQDGKSRFAFVVSGRGGLIKGCTQSQ